MKYKLLGIIGLCSILLSCADRNKPLDTNLVIDTIAFGSCNKEYEAQPFWAEVAAQNPDLWIWLGDNIYADTADMTLMAEKYQQQQDIPEYNAFRSRIPITGIWDDHDYGMNDGNRTFSQKEAAKGQFMKFMGLDSTHAVNQHSGIYQSLQFGQPPQQIKLFLLDTRTFQDPLVNLPKGSEKNYAVNPGTILGAEQWAWLSNELHQSDANINLIASSIQVIAADHRYEMWANFPQEREKLLDLIVASKIKNPLILSGDRHLSEVSKINWHGQIIYDITASGLTHSYNGTEEYNSHRVGHLVTDTSFSTMKLNWQNSTVTVTQFSTQGQVLNQVEIKLQ
ncbi:alkaline phosphatase D family protein [Marinicella litoralis]|uniref:Alkaline phosphatase D n=1 Tax=Marinicella litoralis TaxID=644220 RepID=A0A4R6XL81_9GAMM|nr:alkaline phosphatase D family protein [Marinicella litoralis]TDR20352.1 alkaline phosphatase D [Marinicella litoralis]